MPDTERTTSWVPFALVAVLALGAVLYTVFSPDGIVRWIRLKQEVAKLAAENRELERDNQALRDEAEKLRTERTAVERAIRQDLGYIKSDEVVFMFVPPVTDAAKGRR